MSATTTAKTVRDLALQDPNATRVFERFGIDYCCGGGTSLEDACRARKLSLLEVTNALEAPAASHQAGAGRNWQVEPLADLIAHIKQTHHKFTRDEIARLTALSDKVCSVHGERHPELLHLRTIFRGLAQELATHMLKEEMVLFPYIIRIEEAVLQGEPIVPAPFGSVQNPITMMNSEHDSAGRALRALREASDDYTPPADTCVSYQTLYSSLAAFEQDLHQHIHLENNILFPRVLAMESTS
ncbi:MAG TPA: iron-sulfur cluster repair di-iron protein [Terriglobales bacterium]|jgi:regulator of cell morphogenesis and NO signaling